MNVEPEPGCNYVLTVYIVRSSLCIDLWFPAAGGVICVHVCVCVRTYMFWTLVRGGIGHAQFLVFTPRRLS